MTAKGSDRVIAKTQPPKPRGKVWSYHALDCPSVRPGKRKVGEVWTEMLESDAIVMGYEHHPGYDGCFPEREG